ncbi:hypothetical protein [Hydrogenobacter hydrogenophilus]|uniref:Major Facilitator Superfamily protein n=1 Tax=Hydrogenobacter hydrogenophilus TaxID=35835 RepID=A0A285P2Y6_9AQUI|nr:hypothetical protein [Hydrogenobacter hydrogenophilus]SNZ15798.1 hypothetical protein SAMN06265353_1452 [Hydrogenobacter hydrogenophilus]
MPFLLYVLFEFVDTIFSSFLIYIYFPSKSYGILSASTYGYAITVANALGFLLLWAGMYGIRALNYSFYIITLLVLCLLIGFLPYNSFVLILLFLFVVFHTAFFFWYEVLATKFEKFEIAVGLSYASGFLALGLLMLFESLNLPLLSLLYSFALLSMLFLRGVPFGVKRLSFSQIKRPKFLAEVFTVWIMGEYAEVLSSMAYYVLRDSSALNEAYIHKLFGIALLTAFFCAILSPFLMEKLGIKNFGTLTIFIMMCIPALLGFPSLFPLLAVMVGVSIAFYWVFFRTYLYYRYPKEEYIHRFMFFYFASHLGGIFLYSTLFEIFHSHQLSLLAFSALLIPTLALNLFFL